MSKHRTRKEKQKADVRRAHTTTPIIKKQYTYKVEESPTLKKNTHSSSSILSVPEHYILADIRKTVILSIVFIALILAIYFYQEQVLSLSRNLL